MDGAMLEAWEGPAILLVDLDAFFASVEQLDHPEWRGKPVIVGGRADAHGVVSTCSYEARAFGVRSAMAASTAARLCPKGIFTPGRHDRYKEVSRQVMAILADETPHVQQVSIDEAFLDVSPTRVNREHPVDVARRIQRRVEALGVTCSIGLGTTKSVAKIASDMDKPRGLTVVYPGSEESFLAPLPVGAMSGVGPAAKSALEAEGIRTLGDMARADEAVLRRVFGVRAPMMAARARGTERSAVASDDEVKSVSSETTYAKDLTNRSDVEAAISAMAAKTGRRTRRKGLKGSTVTLKLRYADRSLHSAQRQLEAPTDDDLALVPILRELLDGLWHEPMKVRLVGVGLSGFDSTEPIQGRLFDLAADTDGDGIGEASWAEGEDAVRTARRPRRRIDSDPRLHKELLAATDALKDRFGDAAVRFGHEIRSAEHTTGTPPDNGEG